jgi:hypothetical protein
MLESNATPWHRPSISLEPWLALGKVAFGSRTSKARFRPRPIVAVELVVLPQVTNWSLDFQSITLLLPLVRWQSSFLGKDLSRPV